MFAYCGNNPVNRADSSGHFFNEIWEFAKNTVEAIGNVINSWSQAYSYCGQVAELDGPAPYLDIAAAAGTALLTIGAIGVGTYQTLTSPAPSLSVPKVETKEKEVTLNPPPKTGTTYYHVTTPSNAASIMMSGTMVGSSWEGGYVYAWRERPSKYAMENSGAHFGTIISFKTNVPFVNDNGIYDQRVRKSGPVKSIRPGPITVWDVHIVG